MDTEEVRVAVYQEFRRTGRPPSAAELAARFNAGEAGIKHALASLHEARHLVLGHDGEIVMAHPFAAVPLGFSVMGTATLWWGGCCWDSFALAHLLDEPDVLVASRCPGCDRPGAWVVNRGAPPESSWLAHFLVPVAHMWDDVVRTCAHQRLFCSVDCLDGWLAEEGLAPGYVMDVATLWRLASHWYDGRLEPGYRRREPTAAAEYFGSVGLRGAFWGLADESAGGR